MNCNLCNDSGYILIGTALCPCPNHCNRSDLPTATQIIVEHGKTKRTVEGAFNLCGGRKTLLAIAQQINDQCHDKTFSYGWVRIYPMQPQLSVINARPIGWDA